LQERENDWQELYPAFKARLAKMPDKAVSGRPCALLELPGALIGKVGR
jgi:hypothetical protein